ncbi:MAG: competence/damage-inducible protein A [Bacteroidales bacterium]|nr:competence/damage-inducible protein A [Bacteroidales bacterium]
MNIRIINIGDELLIGQVINSNAAVMSEMLLKNGFFVDRTVVTGDKAADIYQEIESALRQVDAVIVTGGLGPTKDDITKKVICDYFHTTLRLDQPTYDFVSRLLASRGMAMTETNKTQAMVPQGADILPNPLGTAPGLWLEEQGKVLISLPGVPYEMKGLMQEEVIPRLQRRFMPGEHYLCRVVQTIGIGESFLSDLLEPWELSLPPHISLAYLPDGGIIRLRLTGSGPDEARLAREVDAEVERLCALAGDYVFARKDQTMTEVVADLLKERQQTLATAESCTGGFIAHQITSMPGCSAYYKGSVVSYANEAKQQILHVSADDLASMGAVSHEVVEQMAQHARELFQTDYAVATSGIAGPDGGSPEKPVGTVWMAVASARGVSSRLCHFGPAGGRMRVVGRATNTVMEMLRREIIAH